jgi:hypothetical protein
VWLKKHDRIGEFPNVFQLQPSTRWREKHGDDILGDLKGLIDNYHITLESVAQKHGITRERIRQLFELYYGFKYTVAVNTKSAGRKRMKYETIMSRRNPNSKVERFRDGSNSYKGAVSEKKVFDICAALGYEIKPYESTAIDIIINGHKVDVKAAYKTCLTRADGITPLYHFRCSEAQRFADFIICHAVPMNSFFVIPIDKFPECGELYIPSVKTRKWVAGRSGNIKRTSSSKYYDYLEAWHLLKKEPEEVIFSELKLVV